MFLETSFYRLPLQFDARRMLEEVRQFRLDEWRPDRFGLAGYSSINLIAHRGQLNSEHQNGPFWPTPKLERCGYLQTVLQAFGCPVAEVRLRRLASGAEIYEHYDTDYLWFDRLRLHVPVLTDPGVEFHCGGDQVHMAAGEAWVFDRLRLHKVTSRSKSERIHLILDVIPSPVLLELMEAAERPFQSQAATRPARCIGPDERPGRLVCLSTASPAVLPPGEVDRFIDDLVRRHERSGIKDASRAVALVRELKHFGAEWAALWAEHGDARAAWPRYQACASGAFERIRRIEGSTGTMAPGEEIHVASLYPSLAHRLLNFIVSGAINPRLAPAESGPLRPDDRLELAEELSGTLAADGTLRVYASKLRKERPLELDELSLLCAAGSGRSFAEVVSHAGLDAEAGRRKVEALLEDELLTRKPPPLAFGTRRAASESPSPPAAKEEPTARVTRSARLRLKQPLPLLLTADGRIGCWIEREAVFRSVGLAAIHLLAALAPGRGLVEAAEGAGLETGPELELFAQRLVDMALVEEV